MRLQERERQEKEHAIGYRKAECFPSAVVQRAARRRNGCIGGNARGNWDLREGEQKFQPIQNWTGDCTTTLKWLLIGAGNSTSLS